MARLDLLDLGGGYNDGVSPVALADNQSPLIRNLIPYGSKLLRRPGVKQIAFDATGNFNPNSAFAIREQNPDGTTKVTVIVGLADSLAKVSGQGFVNLSGAQLGGSGPFHFLQYLSAGYAVRKNSGLQRFDSGFYEPAGMPPPATAPTLVDGAAGVVEAGNYFGVYTDFNVNTGAESNPSPVSTVLAHAAAKVINWTFAISPTRQANARRLYRTLPDAQDEYFLVTTVPDNTSTTYVDNVIVNNLGVAVSFNNGLPPGGLTVIAIWNERLVASDGVDVFLSEALQPESWAEDTILEVMRDNGGEVRALVALGDRCIVGKTNGVFGIQQTGPRSFERVIISDRHGLLSQASCKVAEGRLIGYGGDNFYVCDGLSMKAIGTKEIRDILDEIPEDLKSQVCAEIWPERSLYVASLPQENTLTAGARYAAQPTDNLLMVAYNYKDGTWTIFDHVRLNGGLTIPTPSFMTQVFDAEFQSHIYACYPTGDFSSALYELFTGKKDVLGQIDPVFMPSNEHSIRSIFRTKQFLSKEGAGLALALDQLWILCEASNTPLKIQIFKDESDTMQVERSVMLEGDGWKLFNLTNRRDPGSVLQVGIEYSGTDDEWEVEALALEVTNIFRSRRAV